MLPDDAQNPDDFPPTLMPSAERTPPPPDDDQTPRTRSPEAGETDGTLLRAHVEAALATTRAPASAQVPGYEVLGELGRGGMGIVYKARDRLERVVALKMILHAGHAGDDERRRFLLEAEAIAAIRHPGVVQVFDFGTHDGAPYFALVPPNAAVKVTDFGLARRLDVGSGLTRRIR